MYVLCVCVCVRKAQIMVDKRKRRYMCGHRRTCTKLICSSPMYRFLQPFLYSVGLFIIFKSLTWIIACTVYQKLSGHCFLWLLPDSVFCCLQWSPSLPCSLSTFLSISIILSLCLSLCAHADVRMSNDRGGEETKTIASILREEQQGENI